MVILKDSRLVMRTGKYSDSQKGNPMGLKMVILMAIPKEIPKD